MTLVGFSLSKGEEAPMALLFPSLCHCLQCCRYHMPHCFLALLYDSFLHYFFFFFFLIICPVFSFLFTKSFVYEANNMQIPSLESVTQITMPLYL